MVFLNELTTPPAISSSRAGRFRDEMGASSSRSVSQSREQIEAIVREDPFVQRGLADFRIISFARVRRQHDIAEREWQICGLSLTGCGTSCILACREP